MRLDRKTILTCVACVILWNWATGTGGDSRPTPRPLDDRPILRWVAKTARTLLWLSLVAEGPPECEPCPPTDQRLVHSTIGDDGYPQLNHAEGW